MALRVEGRLDGAGGIELFWQGWSPGPDMAAGVLLICHGLGEHSARYGSVVDALAPDGWAVYGLDHRGHGRSGGRRTHVDRYADLLDDFETFRRHVAARHEGVAVFLLGHSLGGQIALAYALDHPDALGGLVLSAPTLASAAVPKAAVPVLRLLARIAPTLRPTGIDDTKISKDPAVVADYRADPLVHHGNPTLGLASALYAQFEVLPSGPGRCGCRCCSSTAPPTPSATRPAAGCSRRPTARPMPPCAGTTACGTRSTTSRSASARWPTCGSGWPRTAER